MQFLKEDRHIRSGKKKQTTKETEKAESSSSSKAKTAVLLEV
jgi:hypothetical protein